MNTHQLLALILMSLSFWIFRVVMQESTIENAEWLVASGVGTLTFCILFFPLIVKHGIFRKLNWVDAWSKEQRIAMHERDYATFSLHSDGCFNRLKPYAYRIVVIIMLLFVTQIILPIKPVAVLSFQSHLNFSLICMAFYFIGVLTVICVNMFFTLRNSQ